HTHVTLAVQNAAAFSKATFMVSVCAIIMTSLLNIVQWMADVWRMEKNELIVYTLFKGITRLLVCQPCFGDGWLKKRAKSVAAAKTSVHAEDQVSLLGKQIQDPGGGKDSTSISASTDKNHSEEKVNEKDKSEDISTEK